MTESSERIEPILRANISLVLLDAMKMRGLSVERLSQVSGIAEHILQMLLEEKFRKLPAAPYLRGYMIKLGEVLKLEGEELWRIYIESNPELRKSGTKDELPRRHFLFSQMTRRHIVIIGVSILILGLFSWRIFGFFSGGDFTISNIPDEYIVTNPEFTIRGIVDTSSQLAVNGEIVYSDKEGNFEKTVALHPGFNTFTFTVKRVLGKERRFMKQIFYEQSVEEKIANEKKNIQSNLIENVEVLEQIGIE